MIGNNSIIFPQYNYSIMIFFNNININININWLINVNLIKVGNKVNPMKNIILFIFDLTNINSIIIVSLSAHTFKVIKGHKKDHKSNVFISSLSKCV